LGIQRYVRRQTGSAAIEGGDLNRELFFDNVRDFQGHNPVNSEINHTLAASQLRRNFPLLNNGVTIVARELSRRGDIFRISDFQIVNGCQTTHILFQNKTKIDADTFIPVKLVATSDTQVITEVIKATNRQTAVHPEALESLTKFHKDLEDFYSIREADRDLPDRIHYERRSKQYARDNISPKNIVTLTAQIKSYIGMFLNEPHSHPRYYGELLRSYEGRIFANDHKPAPYYASGVALQTIENWLNSRQADREMRFYKYQLLMLLRAQISGPHVPKPNSNVISEYSLKIVDILRDPERRDKECRRAAELLRATLDKFGTRRGERNPPHRLRAFTEQLIKSISHGHPVQTDRKRQKSVTPRGSERGQIIWFDEWKNYGFIERDSGGDIFVHESQINSIPWHLRLPGKRVQYEVVSNPKSPTMLMASKVKLE
ncbi:MAG: AIPR family protein, partial [Caldilineaceae bacterium]|nr:AIPR family protein [Caldilineaceae bacterium]